MHRALALGLGLAVASPALAQDVTFNWDPNTTGGVDTNAIEAEMGPAITDNLRLGDMDAYMASMANAAAMSTRGMGVDYASNPEAFVLGGSFGAGGHSAGFPPSQGDSLLPQAGIATQLTLMAGMNLGVFTKEEDAFLNRVRIYVHGLALQSPADGNLKGKLSNYGGNLQLQVLKKKSLAGAVEWGGLAFTTGAEVASYQLALAQPLPVESGGTSWNAEGTYDIKASALNVPIEVSTNLRVLVVNAFVGGAVDIQPGSAESTLALAGPLSVDANGSTVPLGDVTVSMTGTGETDFLTPRLFAGGQVDIFFVKLYGQLNLATNYAAGAHLGVRVAI